MGRKEGFCDSCQQNKGHRRVAGVFSLLNLMLLGVPSFFGISTWRCTHCHSTRIFLALQRELSRKLPANSFRKVSLRPLPNAGLKPQDHQKVETTRSRLYSEKYRDAVVKRIVSGITSVTEVRESLEMSEHEVVCWIKESFQRKEDRVEMLREALMLYKKDSPDFDVEQLVFDLERSDAAQKRSRAAEQRNMDDQGSMQRSFAHPDYFAESLPYEG